MLGRDDFIAFLIAVSGKPLPPHVMVLVDKVYLDDARVLFLETLGARAQVVEQLTYKMQGVLEAIRERGIKIPFAVEESPDWGAWRKTGQYCR